MRHQSRRNTAKIIVCARDAWGRRLECPSAIVQARRQLSHDCDETHGHDGSEEFQRVLYPYTRPNSVACKQ
jgi:hypothetical protein